MDPPFPALPVARRSAPAGAASGGADHPLEPGLGRRRFLSLAASAPFVNSTARGAAAPVIDTHIHLFDTSRPQGVPWPPADDAVLYRPALPERYARIAKPFGIVGAIVVEASPWLEDNQWVLDVAANSPIVVGVVGNLEAGKPGFAKNLERFRSNPLFLGIRCGNLWDRDLAADVSRPQVLADLKLLSAAGLALDVANPDPPLVNAVLRLADKLPDLRIVIDHLPHLRVPAARAARAAYFADLREIGHRPKIYVKLSEVITRGNGRAITDVNSYGPILDELTGIFGEDRVLYGSDWPNSDHVSTYPELFGIVREYFNSKTPVAAGKFFFRNSLAAYRWKPRDSSQRA